MSTDKKSILLVLPRFPLPTDKGDKLRAWEQIKVLSEKFTLYVICFHEHESIEDSQKLLVEKYVKEMRIFPINKWDMIWAGIRMFFKNIPFQVGYYYHPWFKKELEKFCEDIHPDMVFFQLIRVASYRPVVDKYTSVLDLMDCMSHNVFLRLQTEKGIAKYFWNLEYKRLLQYEKKSIEEFDYSCIISERDRIQLPQNSGSSVSIMSNGIDTETFKPSPLVAKTTDILFVGNLSYKPNIEACLWLVEEILPKVHALGIFPKVKLVGSSPDRRVLKLAEYKNVEVHANVPETVPFYQDAKIMAAPMRINTGQQNKVLEAMACECHVITTSNANDGIQAPSHVLEVADTSELFAEKIVQVLKGELTPGASSREFVINHFGWKANTLSFFEKIV